MSIFDKILLREEFRTDPPILIDIGASGTLHKEWIHIAKYSVCTAFDADAREMGYIVEEKAKYKRLNIYNCVVSNKKEGRKNTWKRKKEKKGK